MYNFIKILIGLLCICCCAYIYKLKKEYKNDPSESKESIIKYFKENKATCVENGVKTKDLPKDIAKNPYLLMMVQDKTLSFKKGKYFLNK